MKIILRQKKKTCMPNGGVNLMVKMEEPILVCSRFLSRGLCFIDTVKKPISYKEVIEKIREREEIQYMR